MTFSPAMISPAIIGPTLKMAALATTVLTASGWAAPSSATEVASTSVIEEIVVTARKREERSRDVPVALTVLTDVDLGDQSARDVADLRLHTPNLQVMPFPAVGADVNLAIRGQSLFEPIITLDPPVGLYVDGVYLGRSTAALMTLLDLERVEVLMGPQGTLYGRNTTGGVVNLISKRNDPAEFGGFLDLVAGQHGRADVTGALSIPLVDHVAGMRLSFRDARRDGYGRNRLLGEFLDDEDIRTLRANFSWAITDDVDLFVSYDTSRQRERSAFFRLDFIDPAVLDPGCSAVPAPALGCFINQAITQGAWPQALAQTERRQNSDVSSRHDVDVWGVSSTVTARVADLEVKTITAYRELSRRNINDIDGTEWAILHPDAEASQHQFSQELQLTGVASDGLLEWTTGLFYFDEEGEDGSSVIGVPALNPFSPSTIEPRGENTSIAGYLHLDYRLARDTRVSAGARYTRERRRLLAGQTNAAGCTLEFINRPPCSTAVHSDFDGWSYTLGIDHHLTPDHMIYASIGRGFKSGGFNGRALRAAEFEPFDPETVHSFEVGTKSAWLGNRVRVEAAAFYSSYSDIQRSQLIALSATDIGTTVTNAADATVFGLEVQASAQVHPHVRVSATAGLTEAKYRDFNDVDRAGNTIDKSRLEFPNTPRSNYSAIIRYARPVDLAALEGELALQADWVWQSKIYHDIDNTEIDQESYSLVNARASLFIYAWDLELALYAHNVTNRTFVTGGLDLTNQFGYRGTFLGPPRSVNAQLTWNFR